MTTYTSSSDYSVSVAHVRASNVGWIAYWAIAGILLAASYWHKAGRAGGMLLEPLVLSQENNLGAWWSGMSLFASCVVALSLVAPLWDRDRRAALGFAGVAFLMFGLTLDEIGSLHERANLFLPGEGHKALLLPAAAGGLVLAVSLALLWLRRAAFPRAALLIGIAFVLFGSVYGQEVVEHFVYWPDSLLPTRLVVEEGTELVAMALVLVTLIRAGRSLQRPELDRLRDIARGLAIAAALTLLASGPLLVMARTIGAAGFKPNWGNFTTAPLAMLFAVGAWACALRSRPSTPIAALWLLPAALLVFLSAQSVAYVIGGRFHETAATGAIRAAVFGVPAAAAVVLTLDWRGITRVSTLALAMVLAAAAWWAPWETVALGLSILAAAALAGATVIPPPPTAPR